MFRSAAFACAVLIAAVTSPAVAETGAPATCEPTSFRIYFEHGSDALTPMAMDTLNAAARNVAGCAYAELHVSVAAGAHAARRGDAIISALDSRDWDAARVEPRLMSRVAAGPEFAEVTMTPNVMPVPPATAPAQEAGV